MYLYILLSVAGADVNRHTANNDHTVLSLACSGGHISTVQYLLNQGASPTHILRVSGHDNHGSLFMMREFLCCVSVWVGVVVGVGVGV